MTLPCCPDKVKSWQVRVMQGDTLPAICERLICRCPNRIKELAGANVHRTRFSHVIDQVCGCRLPQRLIAGEYLNVPGSWPEPRGGVVGDGGQPLSQAAGAGLIDPLAGFIAALGSYYNQVIAPAAPPLPPGIAPRDLASVVAVWWPIFMQGTPARLPPVEQLPTAGPQVAQLVALLFARARELLASTSCTPAIARRVPWDLVPWHLVPWTQINQWAEEVGWTRAQCWHFLAQSQAAPAFRSSPQGSIGLEFQQPSPWTSAAVQSVYDPSKEDFSAPPYTRIPWPQIDWTAQQWTEFFTDPEVKECLENNKAQIQRIAACQECFKAGGPDKLKKYLCDTTQDPCDCKDQPTTELPPVTQPPAGRPPGEHPAAESKTGMSLPTILFAGAGVISIVAAASTLFKSAKE